MMIRRIIIVAAHPSIFPIMKRRRVVRQRLRMKRMMILKWTYDSYNVSGGTTMMIILTVGIGGIIRD